MNEYNYVLTPIFKQDKNGAIKPNPLFHRPWDNLHSRCIEYPFAASELGNANCILDVGTVKSDAAWISWLERLPIDVHATDYDSPLKPFKNITFHQADVRHLPFKDETFDKVIAVSVIEHIGLQSPQVNSQKIPKVELEGDLEAVRELTRILKDNGELIMTLPFGVKDELILGKQARNYTIRSIRKFEKYLQVVKLDYYEYQLREPEQRHETDLPGLFTWHVIPLTKAKAVHKGHTEGVICGVWRKSKNLDRRVRTSLTILDLMEAGQLKKERKLEEAVSRYNKVVNYNPSSGWSHYNLAEALIKQGKIDEAITAYHQAIELKPRTASFQYKLAEALVKKGRLEEAIKHYQKASELNPDFPLFQRKLAEIIKLHQEVSECPT